MTNPEHTTPDKSLEHRAGSTAAEASGRRHNRSHPSFKAVAAVVGLLAVAGGGYFVYDKIQVVRAEQRAEQKAIIEKADAAKAAAAGTIERQRLDPSKVHVLSGILKLPPGTVLSSSPVYVGDRNALGTKIVPAGTTLVVLNPIGDGNTYQVGPACDAPRPNKFVSANDVAETTYWLKALQVPAVAPIKGQPPKIKATYNDNYELVDASNQLLGCYTAADKPQLDLIDRLTVPTPPKK